jgi:glucose/arabinose dehydrogenase
MRLRLRAAALAGSLLAATPLAATVVFSPLVEVGDAPVAFVDPPDGRTHRLIATQPGQIRVWDGSSPSVSGTPMLDLRDDPGVPVAQRKVNYGGERGLLAMTVHPDYAANGFVYLYYTSRNWDGAGGIADGDIVVERYTRDAGDPDLLDFGTSQILLVVPHPDSNHNGGDLEFGPDGFLYVTLGDGGGGCDSTAGSGQDTNQLLGKMLRLDVDGADAFPGDPLRNYAIPPGNPLVGVAGLDEIWALGLRNPFRFSFDRSNGDIYIGDVGQDDWEEINLLLPGTVLPGAPVNFGWPCREGFDAAGCGTPPQGCAATFRNPVRVEANSGGTWGSIMGGHRYRGGAVAGDLADRYVYGDAGNGEVWAATIGAPNPTTAPGWSSVELTSSGLGPFGFSQDQAGELYLLSGWFGRIDCIQPSGGDCHAWAGLADIFLDGFEVAGTGNWSVVDP